MDVDVLDEIWCCFPDAHAGQICATVEGVGSRTSTLATKRFPRVALLHQDRPTVSDGNHLCDEASSQEKRRPHQEAASHEHRRRARGPASQHGACKGVTRVLSCTVGRRPHNPQITIIMHAPSIRRPIYYIVPVYPLAARQCARSVCALHSCSAQHRARSQYNTLRL